MPSEQRQGDIETCLRDVCARPEDNAPKLRYAGLLDASGNPDDAVRAEFIRVQCELARTAHSDERWIQLWERKTALEINTERWAEELPKFEGVRWNPLDFPRGFAWDIWCDDTEAFQRNAAAIFAAAPIQSATIIRPRSLSFVMEVAELSQVTRLIITDSKLGPADARALAASPYLSNLTELHISGNRFGDEGAMALAASSQLHNLRDLNLGNNQIGDKGAMALAASPVVANLSHLGLADNAIKNAGAIALASSPYLKNITGLTLWGCDRIGRKGMEALYIRFGEDVSFAD